MRRFALLALTMVLLPLGLMSPGPVQAQDQRFVCVYSHAVPVIRAKFTFRENGRVAYISNWDRMSAGQRACVVGRNGDVEVEVQRFSTAFRWEEICRRNGGPGNFQVHVRHPSATSISCQLY